MVSSNLVIRACLFCGTGKSPDCLHQCTINFNSATEICSFVFSCSFNVSTFPQSTMLNSCCLFVSFVLMTPMSEIRFCSSVAARIFGIKAKVCAGINSPAVILFLCPSMWASDDSILFLVWASRLIPFCTSPHLQNSLNFPSKFFSS